MPGELRRASTIGPASIALAALGLVWPLTSVARAQSDAWVVELRASGGSLGAEDARSVIEAARGEIAECTDGPGPHRFDYTVSLRPNGQVREAAYDRGATSDPRAARCIRHALLELRFPAHADAGTFALTLRAGEFAPSPSAPPPGPIASPPPGPIASPPPGPIASPPPGPIATPPPGPIAIPVPRPTLAPTSTDVTLGAIGAVGGHTSEQLVSVIAPQRPGLVACYATARAADATLSGDATLHLTISAEGRVTNALFQGSEALASALAGCVSQAARGWTFGATSAEARVSVPLTFGASSRPVRR